MNSRIMLADFADRLKVQLDPGILVSTSYDAEYRAKFARVWPAVWVVALRMLPRSDGTSFSAGRSVPRQNMSAQIIVRPVVERFADGDTDYRQAETRLDVLQSQVASALYGWTPARAQRPLVWASITDGAAYETVVSSDMIFETWFSF